MLKIEKIIFSDKEQRTYTIKKHQLEQFPLIGGNNANMITTKVWNQHGNNFVDSYMESYDGEIIFALYISDKTHHEQEELRRELTNILNPLNGVIQMQVHLNTGAIYNRDITFVAAPSFPIGEENRNEVWQKVQLQYTANNPFWYSQEEFVETFQAVEPMFLFPFEMKATTDRIRSGYEGKIYGSVVENPNLFRYTQSTALKNPADFTAHSTQSHINAVQTLDNTSSNYAATAGNIPQMIWSFNIIEILTRKYGAGIWRSTLLADRIAQAAEIITRLRYYYYGYGTTPTGNKIVLARWNTSNNTWYGNWAYTDSAITLRPITSATPENNIDAGGFSHLLAYTDAASTTVNSMLRTDQIYLEIDTIFDEPIKPVIFGNILPSNIATNEGQVAAPVVIKIIGACVNPRIDNLTTGEFIKFKDTTLAADDVLEIDTTFGQKKVLLNGENYFHKLDFSSTFFNMKIGENEIEFTDDTGSTTAAIHFIYRNLFISI